MSSVAGATRAVILSRAKRREESPKGGNWRSGIQPRHVGGLFGRSFAPFHSAQDDISRGLRVSLPILLQSLSPSLRSVGPALCRWAVPRPSTRSTIADPTVRTRDRQVKRGGEGSRTSRSRVPTRTVRPEGVRISSVGSGHVQPRRGRLNIAQGGAKRNPGSSHHAMTSPVRANQRWAAPSGLCGGRPCLPRVPPYGSTLGYRNPSLRDLIPSKVCLPTTPAKARPEVCALCGSVRGLKSC